MQDYPRFHQNKTNLLLHIVMVPLFVVGVLYARVVLHEGDSTPGPFPCR